MRRRQSTSISLAAGDPGKDLFAYLFLLIMVFSFMLLMSSEQTGNAQKAPEQQKSSKSTFSQIVEKNIATLEKKGTKIFLRFENDLYDPQKDFEKLEQDKRIVVKKQGGNVQKFLYIKKTNHETISLFQYLETFKTFSDHNISIAFAVSVL